MDEVEDTNTDVGEDVSSNESSTSLNDDIAEFLNDNKREDYPETVEARAEEAASVDDSDDEDEPDDDESSDEENTENSEASEAMKKAFLDNLSSAIDSGNVQLFLDTLGDKADKLLGSAAHKSLRLTAKENRKNYTKLQNLATSLEHKFGDPVKARTAAANGDIDAFIDSVEKQWGNSWKTLIQAVNSSIAGREARIEAKNTQKKQEDTAAQKQREEAAANVKKHVTEVVKVESDKLLAKYPKVVDLVIEKMREQYKNGVNTPKKALELVKKDLQEQAKVLTELFSDKKSKKSQSVNILPPSREPKGRRGDKPMTEDELIEEHLREFKRPVGRKIRAGL